LSTTGKNAAQGAVHVPPWSKHWETSNKSKVDVTDLIKDRDYFEEQQDVWRYLDKYGNAPTGNEPTQREFVRAVRQAAVEPVPCPDRAAKRVRAEDVQSPSGAQKIRKLGELTEEEMALCIDSGAEESDDTGEGDEEEEDNEGDELGGSDDVKSADSADVQQCDAFTADYMTLLQNATSSKDTLDLRNTVEVIKFLNVKNRLREVQVKQGELYSNYYHRVDAWMKRTTIPSKELQVYRENWDYFESAEALGKFIRSQFAVRGHPSLTRAALRAHVREHQHDDEFHIRYNPHDVGEQNAPLHAIAEHLAGQVAGSPCWD